MTKNICILLVTGDAERELHHAIEQPVGEDEVVELRLARHLGADQAGVVIAAIVGVPGHHCLDIWISTVSRDARSCGEARLLIK